MTPTSTGALLSLSLLLGLVVIVTVGACAATPPAATPATAPEAAGTPDMHHGGGHAHNHRFLNAEEWARQFDSPDRDAWQKPDDVVRLLALQGDETVADLGAGTGYFTVRLARALPRGKVLAIDVEQDMVRYLGERAAKEGLANVTAVLAPTDDPHLEAPVDLVLVVDTVHHIEGRPAYFQKVKAKLKAGGRLVIVDFKMGEIPVGPAEAMRIPPAQLTGEMEQAGLKLQSLDEATLPHQYVAIYELGR